MTQNEIIMLVSASVVVFLILVLVIAKAIKMHRIKGRVVENVKVEKGERFTEDNLAKNKDGSANITHVKGDIVLECGKEYLCTKKGMILPGKYTVLASNESDLKFNIRIGGFVREYEHFETIVLAENDVISSVSHNVILR